MEPELSRYLKILVKSAVSILVLVGIYLLFTFVFPILGNVLKAIPRFIMPFLLAFLLALLIEPFILFLQNRLKMGRGPATLVSLLTVIGSLTVVLVFLITRLVNELVGLARMVSGRSADIGQTVIQAIEKAQLFYIRLNLPRDIELNLQESLARALAGLQKGIGSAADVMVGFLAGLPGFFVFFLIAAVATYFIAKERQEIKDWFLRTLPDSWQGKTRNVFRDMIDAFLGFMKAYSLLVSITALQTIIGLKILGVEYALTIGLVTGLFDILPILGPGTVFVPWVIWEFIRGETGLAIGLLILYCIIVAVRQILEPRVIGDNVGLHPLATLVSLYVGLKAGGIVGMVLGPILVVLFLACNRAGLFKGITWNRFR